MNAGFLATPDKAGVSIWDLQSYTEVSQITNLSSLVLALAFNDDSLVALCQDGSLKFVSTQSWIIKRTLDTFITLPTAVKEWSGAQFWSSDFLWFDPVQSNLGFVGKGILARNWFINLETKKKLLVAQDSFPSSTISQAACTKDGDLVKLTRNGDAEVRRLGSLKSPIGHFKYTNKYQGSKQSTSRLLAVSTRSRFAAICRVTIVNGSSRSDNEFECLGRDFETSVLTELVGVRLPGTLERWLDAGGE